MVAPVGIGMTACSSARMGEPMKNNMPTRRSGSRRVRFAWEKDFSTLTALDGYRRLVRRVCRLANRSRQA